MANEQNSDEITYTLTPQPGIKRDGTLLEGEFCSDGEWVRFQRGKAKKMGGYRRISDQLTGPIRRVLVWSRQAINSCVVFSSQGIEALLLDNNLVGNDVYTRTPIGFVPDPNNMWTAAAQYDAAVGSQGAIIVAHCSQSSTNIDDATLSKPYWALAGSSASVFVQITDAPAVSGGIFALDPYTVAYSSDGLVSWSDANQPQVWSSSTTPGDAGASRVTGTKIVCGLPLRSGSLAGMLWSLDSVIRMDYIGGDAIFKFSTLSTQSSILASNSVIEYDGIYFWIGIDRFMYFDSSVKELQNDMDQNWFFDNLNFEQRQKIWVTKIPRFGEVIWHFPFGTSLECNATVVFNVRLKTWYDSSIARSAGFYTQTFKYPIWAGAQPEASGKYGLYQHEFGYNAIVGDVESAIRSSFTTQNFGYPTGGIGDSTQGISRWARLTRVEPDFIQQKDMTVTVIGYEFAQTAPETSSPYAFTPSTGKVDMREQRRHLLLKFESNEADGFYEAGKVIVHMEPGDNRS